jgi:hypothetical protein
MKKFIREGRMGPPFSYKTGAVVSSYPKPMLVLEFDTGGLDVVKAPIVEVDPSKIVLECKREQKDLPPIQAVLFNTVTKRQLDFAKLNTDGNAVSFAFLDVVNKIVLNGCPWKTIVLDPITGLTEAFIGHIYAVDSEAMKDARNWASRVGVLIQRSINVIQGLPCHTVFIIHVQTDKNEITGEIVTEPMIPSAIRQHIGRLFSQMFYAVIEQGKPVVYTSPTGFVKSVGMRKPEASPAKMGALFSDIYGSEEKI